MEKIFFDTWFALFRTFMIGVLAYVSLILLLRVTGKRTLSKMNAFDFVVTVALGSTLATILLSKDVSLANGVLALGLLVGLQYIITWLSVRTRWVRRMVTGEPSMLVYRGDYLPHALRKTRVTKDEILAVLRSEGLTGPEEAEAVVLETDGSFSVLKKNGSQVFTSLSDVKTPHERNENEG